MHSLADRIKNTLPITLFFFGIAMFTYGYLSHQSNFTLPGLVPISLGIFVLDLCIIAKKDRGPNKAIKELIERMDKTPEDDSAVVAE